MPRRGSRRREEAHVAHPDPATELQLREIAGLVRMRDSAEEQVALYQQAIAQCDADDAQVVDRHSRGFSVDPAYVTEVNARRRKAAEAGIREQREFLMTLGSKISDAIREAGLSPDDLAYLDLSRRAHA